MHEHRPPTTKDLVVELEITKAKLARTNDELHQTRIELAEMTARCNTLQERVDSLGVLTDSQRIANARLGRLYG